MALPRGSDYHQAVQAPNISFADAELKAAHPEVDMLGLPKPYSGGFTTTFKLRRGGEDWAVRCFTREIQDLKRRYEAINNFLFQAKSKYFVDARFLPDGIRVSGILYPIIKMKWLNGEPLNLFLSNNYSNKRVVESLIDDFLGLVKELETHNVAHGDLQHGNILVRGNQIFLIDYDGMYLPQLSGLSTNEIGHVNYQHPQRTSSHFNKDIDRFASIVIYTALKAISLNPGLWKKYDNGENLLFKQTDFANLSSSQLIHDLYSIPEVRPLVDKIGSICNLEFDKIPSLSSFIAGTFSYSPLTLTRQQQPTSITRSQYLVIDGTQKGSILEHVGEKVEIVGQITAFKRSLTTKGQPYVMMNMGGAYPIHTFTIVLWSESISSLKSAGIDPVEYRNQWVSVIGVISQYKGRPQLYIEQHTQLRMLGGKQEAQMLLIQRPIGPTVSNKPLTNATSNSGRPRQTGDKVVDTFNDLYGRTTSPQAANRTQNQTRNYQSPTYTTQSSTSKPSPKTQSSNTSNNKGCVVMIIFVALGAFIGGLISESPGGVIGGAFVGFIVSSFLIKT